MKSLRWNLVRSVITVNLLMAGMVFALPAYAGNDDSNDKEVGVEWVEDYSARGWEHLKYQQEEATKFYDELGELGWTKVFNWGNGKAWERDFEKPSVGGRDWAHVDGVDFAYFTGYGSPSCFHFGTNTDGDGQHPWKVWYDEVEWGDEDLEWIALACCLCLYHGSDNSIWDRWGRPGVFQGLHGILGFKTTSRNTGASLPFRFVTYMQVPFTIADSWRYATYFDQPSDRQAAWLSADDAEQPGTQALLKYEYLPGLGRVGPDTVGLKVYGWWQC